MFELREHIRSLLSDYQLQELLSIIRYCVTLPPESMVSFLSPSGSLSRHGSSLFNI